MQAVDREWKFCHDLRRHQDKSRQNDIDIGSTFEANKIKFKAFRFVIPPESKVGQILHVMADGREVRVAVPKALRLALLPLKYIWKIQAILHQPSDWNSFVTPLGILGDNGDWENFRLH